MKVLCIVLFCAGSINLCQAFVFDIWSFALIQFVYGLFLAGVIPNVNSRLVEVTDLKVRGKAYGLVTTAQQFGGVIGPLLGGFLGSFLETRYVLVFAGVILLCAGIYSYKMKLKYEMQEN